MKIAISKFSVPDCALDEPMPSKAFKLLAFLLRESDYAGACRPGYDAMRRALRDSTNDNGSNHTVRKYLKVLDKMGWIFTMKKTNARMAIWMQIPNRFRRHAAPKTTLSVVHS